MLLEDVPTPIIPPTLLPLPLTAPLFSALLTDTHPIPALGGPDIDTPPPIPTIPPTAVLPVIVPELLVFSKSISSSQ